MENKWISGKSHHIEIKTHETMAQGKNDSLIAPRSSQGIQRLIYFLSQLWNNKEKTAQMQN